MCTIYSKFSDICFTIFMIHRLKLSRFEFNCLCNFRINLFESQGLEGIFFSESNFVLLRGATEIFFSRLIFVYENKFFSRIRCFQNIFFSNQRQNFFSLSNFLTIFVFRLNGRYLNAIRRTVSCLRNCNCMHKFRDLQ